MKASDLVASSLKLLSLPDIYIKINGLLDKPTTKSTDIADCISLDPALCAQMLRIANSTLYSFSTRIDTISRAITVIGMNGVRDLVLASSTIQMFSRLGNIPLDVDAFWQHSVRTAVYSRVLASECNVIRTEPYFISGILHHIGRLLIATKIPEMSRQASMVPRAEGVSSSHVEEKLFGFNHATVGGILLRKWNLPLHVCDAVEYHHSPQTAQDSPMSAAIVHIASILAGGGEKLSEQLSLDQEIADEAWEISSKTPQIIQEISELAEEQCKVALQLFLSKAA